MGDVEKEVPEKRGFLVLEGKPGNRFYLPDLASYIEVGRILRDPQTGSLKVKLLFPKSCGDVFRESIFRKMVTEGEITPEEIPVDD